MKAVDFVVELSEKILFIEVKDPGHPSATPANSAGFVRKFQAGEIDSDLVRKYRDSFLYEWAAEHLGKPVDYLVLVAIDRLDSAMLLTRTEALQRCLPVEGPRNGVWARKIVERCFVYNIDKWNQHLPQYPVRRRGA